jgi:phenylacetate-CoA ligase
VATDSPYWNPKTETLDRERLEALQVAKLRRQCEWAAARSPWYRRHFARARFEPRQVSSLDDLRRLPMLTRDDWMASQEARPPYGEIPTIGGSGAIRIHTTSGTTGRGPLRALDSRKDWAWIAEMWCYGIWGCGIRPLDTAYIAFGYGSFIGFWGLHYAMEKVGVLNVPGGAQTTESRLLQIVDFGATVLAATPTYAIRLAQEAERLGIDLRGSNVNRLILSGEPAGADGRLARDAGLGRRHPGRRPDQMTVDLLGSELSPAEQGLLAVYESLKALCAEDLPPNAHAGVRASLALMHNVVTGLALEYEHLTDLGV